MTVLLLLVCLLISNIISHYIPFIPTALIQITFGIFTALIVRDLSFKIETEWFLLLFVAPLLYNDGRHFPREELWKMKSPIFGNAIVLVLLTTVGGGYFIHWMIPDIPLAAAFALAAILSPTDPVAVNGIATRIHIPDKVLNLVKGESLINDASGLVAFNYAVIAVVTGYFSLQEAIFDFTYKFLAGVALGLMLGLLIIWVRSILRKQGIFDVTFHSLLQIMTPFIIFIITEELLHASGVIAVVVAGIAHSLVNKRTEVLRAEEQVLTENIWSIVLFVLNGIVFLLLGLNIPSSMRESVENPNIEDWLMIGYVIAIGLIILGIRFIWTYFFSYYEYRRKQAAAPNFKTSLITSLTGVRGAVTMAGVLSMPYTVIGGKDFPERSLILFIAAGVIMFTLIMATVFLPLLSKRRSVEGKKLDQMDVIEAKRRILLTAINKIKGKVNVENEAAAYELMGEYKVMFHQIQPEPASAEQSASVYQNKITKIRLLALKAERSYLLSVMDKNVIDEKIFAAFEKSLDHREEALSSSLRSKTINLYGKVLRGWHRFRVYRKADETKLAKLNLGKAIQLRAMKAALEFLQNYAETYERADIVNAVILDYKQSIARLKTPSARYEKGEKQKEELRLMVMDSVRTEIHKMYESGDISREQVKELRRFINHIESITLHEHA